MPSPVKTTDLMNTIESVAGFHVAGVHAGLKKNGKLDFAIIASDVPCVAAGVFTQNTVKAAPVLLNMERLAASATDKRAVAINTVSANACTGEQGMQNARRMSELVAEAIDASAEQIFVMSTGVIGTQLPMQKIEQGVSLASQALGDDWQSAAAAIMTTDTRPKQAAITVETEQGSYTIAGISKGSGMIAPNMATMLCVVTTDAELSPALAQSSLGAAADVSFNRIVVDGDTSTNDMVILLANGQSDITVEGDAMSQQFQAALNEVLTSLSKQIVRDGEGVSKFISLHVEGAHSDEDALQIARTIATSPLVKTAFYGNDANWGRIIAAAGRAGVPFDPDKAALYFAVGEDAVDGKLCLFANGQVAAYSEEDATAIITQDDVTVSLDCGNGDGSCHIWTCDLSHEYVSINGDYRS
ncbi:bifunctional glutamate N-acetyltransferase/amino-acid acetyltransferase ArgJ [Phototrophicus methaneseepsis]|nr:bifunctional glutamate N-acetyltransferase/amino-acid acetyltransferase ArgJ [Phototrophicus methaneseepsis]